MSRKKQKSSLRIKSLITYLIKNELMKRINFLIFINKKEFFITINLFKTWKLTEAIVTYGKQ